MATKGATQPAARELYSFGAKYTIAPESSNRNLIDDASCFLGPIISTINMLAIELWEDGSQIQANPRDAASMLWGVFHQLGMIKGIIDAVEVKS